MKWGCEQIIATVQNGGVAAADAMDDQFCTLHGTT